MKIGRWLNNKSHDDKNGLYASLDELMDMRRYIAYVKGWQKNKILSCQNGDIKSAFKGRGIEFEEIRSYTFGDDVRDIDWRVTARKEVPYTKVYSEEKDYEIYVWLDLSEQMLFGSKKELKSVTAAKVAALLGWLSLENKDRFGCLIFDGEKTKLYKSQNNRIHLMAILKNISLASKQVLTRKFFDEGARAKSLKLLEQTVKNKATVFLLSDFSLNKDNLLNSLAMLAKKNKLYLINVFDILEENPPKSGEYMAEYNGKRLVFDSSAKGYKRDYFSYFAKKRSELRDFANKLGCKVIDLRTDMNIIDDLKFY
ncbi:MAG: DUF58 domain-containing protein [Alphaproteobacteria bacterium]|nr:DUF58 domain-containing protein [Alphaproteobacteria bacterium]